MCFKFVFGFAYTPHDPPRRHCTRALSTEVTDNTALCWRWLLYSMKKGVHVHWPPTESKPLSQSPDILTPLITSARRPFTKFGENQSIGASGLMGEMYLLW